MVLPQQPIKPERLIFRHHLLQAFRREGGHAPYFAPKVRLVGKATSSGQHGPFGAGKSVLPGKLAECLFGLFI